MVKLVNADGSPAIKCQNADCENDLHCFRPKKSAKAWKEPTGDCQYCGENPVDWERVKARKLDNYAALIEELQKEWIRNYFWEKPLDARSKAKLQEKSRETIKEEIRKELSKCVGPALPFWDGRRVPVDDEKLQGKPYAYAQHATASCCTKCAYYWWGFERNSQYTDKQINFLTELCYRYLEHRGVLPNEDDRN